MTQYAIRPLARAHSKNHVDATFNWLWAAAILTLWSALQAPLNADEPLWIDFPAPNDGASKSQRIVLVSGDEEYRSEEALPMLAKILNKRHGFACRVLFAVDPETRFIDPANNQNVPGAESLDDADLIVMALRFRKYPADVMQRFAAAASRGVPIVALRTSTHAFNFPKDSPLASYNNFGKQVLGENWVSHWGRHKSEATRGVIEPDAAESPLLQGVEYVFGDTDVYEAYPPQDAQILLRGQVLVGMSPTGRPAEYEKKRSSDGQMQLVNDPMMPVAWTRVGPYPNGDKYRVFCTTMGSATDLKCDDLRRLIVNAIYWGLELPVPDRADVKLVGEYAPTPYGFDNYRRGVRPSDMAGE